MMNSVERHRLALALKEPDRVPVAPSFLTRTVRIAGVRQYDYHTDPEVLASAQIAHQVVVPGDADRGIRSHAFVFDGFQPGTGWEPKCPQCVRIDVLAIVFADRVSQARRPVVQGVGSHGKAVTAVDNIAGRGRLLQPVLGFKPLTRQET